MEVLPRFRDRLPPHLQGATGNSCPAVRYIYLFTAGARDGVRANLVSVLSHEIDVLGLGCLSAGVQTVEMY